MLKNPTGCWAMNSSYRGAESEALGRWIAYSQKAGGTAAGTAEDPSDAEQSRAATEGAKLEALVKCRPQQEHSSRLSKYIEGTGMWCQGEAPASEQVRMTLIAETLLHMSCCFNQSGHLMQCLNTKAAKLFPRPLDVQWISLAALESADA